MINRILNEETAKKLAQDAEPKIKRKGKRLKVRYLGMSLDGTLFFRCASESRKGKWYEQSVKFKDLEKHFDKLSGSNMEIRKNLGILIKQGNIRVHCTDPSWRYWAYQYKASKNGYALNKEKRAPRRNNKRLRGSVCKHLYAVLSHLDRFKGAIMKDIKLLRNEKGTINKK